MVLSIAPVGWRWSPTEQRGALREHRAALVEERLRLLVAADLAPEVVELSGHAEERDAERVDVAGAHRKVLVAPEGGRQRLDLEVREVFEDVAPAAADMAEIEEERHLRVVLADGAADPIEEVRSGSASVNFTRSSGSVQSRPSRLHACVCAQVLAETSAKQMSMKMPSPSG